MNPENIKFHVIEILRFLLLTIQFSFK